MARPLRLQLPGTISHVTARGNEKRNTFRDDADRERFLILLAETIRRFDWWLYAYALMSNHFHLVVELTRETLSDGMHWLNGEYARWFNRRHERVGHLFQSRYGSVLVDKESYRTRSCSEIR